MNSQPGANGGNGGEYVAQIFLNLHNHSLCTQWLCINSVRSDYIIALGEVPMAPMVDTVDIFVFIWTRTIHTFSLPAIMIQVAVKGVYLEPTVSPGRGDRGVREAQGIIGDLFARPCVQSSGILTIIDRTETMYKYHCTSNCIGQMRQSARTDLVRAGARVGNST